VNPPWQSQAPSFKHVTAYRIMQQSQLASMKKPCGNTIQWVPATATVTSSTDPAYSGTQDHSLAALYKAFTFVVVACWRTSMAGHTCSVTNCQCSAGLHPRRDTGVQRQGKRNIGGDRECPEADGHQVSAPLASASAPATHLGCT
jgi:hypothetical protein